MLMGTATNNPQMEEECGASGSRLLKHSYQRNQCHHLQGDKAPHRVLSDRHVAVLKALIDYADYESSPQEWQHTDCRRVGSNQPLPACAAGSGWYDNSCQAPPPPDRYLEIRDGSDTLEEKF